MNSWRDHDDRNPEDRALAMKYVRRGVMWGSREGKNGRKPGAEGPSCNFYCGCECQISSDREGEWYPVQFSEKSVPVVVYDVQIVTPSTVSGGRSWQTSDGKIESRIRHANSPCLTVKIT